MPKLRVHNFPMSLDGFAAGPDQSLDNPLGVGGMRLHEWVFATRLGRAMMGEQGDEANTGEEGIDNDFFAAGEENIGATLMGRNMFGPIRGDWGDESWKGWWGDNPPYHHDTFVLTHHPRESIVMEGGTTFHFVTEGLEAGVEQAFAAAGGKDVRLGGGVATVRAALRAGLVDELHVPIAPVFLGAGESLFDGMAEAMQAYECVELITSPRVVHTRFTKR